MKYAPMVEYSVKRLVDDPESVEVTEVKDGDAMQVQIRVAQEDTGKVIGRSGRLISALRRVVGLAAEKEGRAVYVKVITD
jgi:predicted RNA-binding protein YlqC (UPF0109 family)